MRLQWVDLDRFRNLDRQKVELHPRYNLLLGRNGQGKTNFLEAIGYLGSLRSFRGAGRSEMIRHAADMCRVSGAVVTDGVKRSLAFTLTRRERSQYLDDRRIGSPEEYLQALKVVHFIPEDVSLVGGSPSWRRKVLDRSVFEVVPGYVSEYRTYLSVLRQRNALLRAGRATREELQSWSGTLSSAGALLVRRRRQLLRSVNPVMRDLGHKLGLSGDLGLVYMPSFEEDASAPEENDTGTIAACILESLSKKAEKEARAGYTLTGPHRDNIVFTLDTAKTGRDLARYGSQGQKRSAVLAFKMALAVVFQRAAGSWPLILLDDVASELDDRRREALGTIIRQTGAQFFISTTGEEFMFLPAREGSIWKVVDGRLEPLEEGGEK